MDMKITEVFSTQNQNEVVISSREIAELTGKRHSDVLRDIERQMNGAERNFASSYKTADGRMVKEYLLPRNEALAIVSGYSFDLRMKIINRLDELENRQPLLTFEEMAKQTILLADKRIRELEFENRIAIEQKIKAEVVAIEARRETSKLIHDGKEYTATEIAKELGLRSAQELNKLLSSKGIQYKQNNTWVLYARYAEQGLTSIKQIELENGRIQYDRRWTGRGRKFIIDLMEE